MKKLLLTIVLTLTLWSPCWASEIYIGQYSCGKNPSGGPGWIPPHQESLEKSIDLRSFPQMEKICDQVPAADGYVVLTYSREIDDPTLIHLGEENSLIQEETIGTLEEKLKITPLESRTPKSVIKELFTDKADSSGETFAKPFLPQKGKVTIQISDQDKIEYTVVPFVSKEWPKVLDVIQRDYKRMVRTEPENLIAQWLDHLEEDYGVPYETFIPDGEIKIAALPHHTVVTDDFTCSDRQLFTTTGCNLSNASTWTVYNGVDNTSVASNHIIYSGTNGSDNYSRVNSDLSSDNHYAKIQITAIPVVSGSSGPLINLRKDSSATFTQYVAYCIDTVSAAAHQTWKIVSSSFTQIGSTATSPVMVVNDYCYAEISSNLVLKINSTTVISNSDSSITGNLRSGYGFTQTVTFSGWNLDNFEQGDLGGGGGGGTPSIPDQSVIF